MPWKIYQNTTKNSKYRLNGQRITIKPLRLAEKCHSHSEKLK